MRIPGLRLPHNHAQTRRSSISMAAVLMAGAIAGILLLGAVLRLYTLDARGFWGDEIWTAQASVSPARDILRYYISYPGPLYYLLAHAAIAVLGDVPLELAVRLPSAIASILCLPVFFALASRYGSRPMAIVAMLLLAVAPYQVWYAQEARFYAWSTLLALLATYALTRALDEPRANRFWIVFGLCSIANLYNQPLPAVFALAGQLLLAGVWLLISQQRRRIVITLLVTYVAIVAGYWPVVRRVSTTGRMDVFDPQTFLLFDVQHFWVTLVRSMADTIDKFAAGGVSGWLFLVLFLVGLLALVRQRQWKLMAIVLVPLVTALLTFAIGQPRTGFIVRYVLYLQPLYLLGVAAGITAVAAWLGQVAGGVSGSRGTAPQVVGWLAGGVVVGLVVLLTTISLWQVRLGYSVAKINDWRAIARYLDAHTQPGDLIAGNRWYKPALSWYLQNQDRVTLSTDTNERVLEDLADGRRVWYVRMGPTEGDVSAVLKKRLPVIEAADWQDPGLDHTSDFYPVSEFRVQLRFEDGGPTATARFYDELPAGDDQKPHRILRPGESVHVQLVLPTSGGTRFLDITHNPRPHAALAVSIDNATPVTIRGQEDTWLDTRLPLPAGSGDTVEVRVQNLGERADRLHELRLVYDDSP